MRKSLGRYLKSLRALGSLAPIQLIVGAALLAAVFVACFFFASDRLPGYPEARREAAPVFHKSTSANNSLEALLLPPPFTLQVSGEPESIAFVLTNRSRRAIDLTPPKLESACFGITEENEAGASQEAKGLRLRPAQSVVVRYALRAVSHPGHACFTGTTLLFSLTYSSLGKSSAVPSSEAIATGPIRLTTRRRLQWERFYILLGKLLPALFLPLLLVAANYLVGEWQRRTADDQKARDAESLREAKLQEQKLEVWKIMIPSMLSAIQTHCVPTVRVLVLLEDEIFASPSRDDDEVLICALLFRAKITYMVNKNGGFYFRNHLGETLCAQLANQLMDRFYALAGDRQAFLNTAERLQPVNSTTQVRQKLSIGFGAESAVEQLRVSFHQKLAGRAAELGRLTVLLRKLLEHEINDPFHGLWYDTQADPLPPEELKAHIDGAGFTTQEAEQVRESLRMYMLALESNQKAGTSPAVPGGT